MWKIKTSNTFDVFFLFLCVYMLFEVGLWAALFLWFLHFILVEPSEPGKWD